MTTVCHIPPDNPENAETITVDQSDVQTHLDQHACDYLGSCNDYFPNGVASGDVDQASVVLWARAESKGAITFEYGRDPGFLDVPDGIQTVVIDDPVVPAKVEFSGLTPGVQYYYRACRGETCDSECPNTMLLGSEKRGKFRTPHASGHNGLRFGVSSCWRGDLKPFESIRNVPDRDLDFFVALGDTTYADSNQTGSRAQDLASYRKKNECQYRGQSCIPGDTAIHDNIFAQVRASTASYVTVDDHEILNDFSGGANPESQRERVECVDWKRCFCPDEDPNNNCDRRFINETDLFNCGMVAWEEHNPIREERYGQTGDSRTSRKRKLYRYRTFGKDAAIFMLDTRSFREAPIELIPGLPYLALPVLSHDRGRTMLGSAQLTDLLRDLKDAQSRGITWKLVLVPEPIQNLGWLLAPDRFEGYARERGQILDFIQSFCIPNVVFVSGDIHATAANNLVYKKNYLALQRYSEAWDISTGAVAYDTPYAKRLVEGLNLALDECQGDSTCESLLPPNLPGEGFDLLPPELQNQLAEELLNAVLTTMGYPNVGLGADIDYPLFLQKENAEIPAALLEGRYSTLASWGWTEFEIDPVTRKLSVTTYGIDPDGEADGEVPVVSKFEVDPRSRSGNGASCDYDTDCASCRCSTLLGECIDGLGDGDVCAFDSQCKSDRCSAMGQSLPIPICQPKLPNGAECLFDDDCRAGDCFFTDLDEMRCWPLPDGVAHAPVITCPASADAGPDQLVECSNPDGALVTLDGTRSAKPGGTTLTYSWTAPGVVFDDPTSPSPCATFPIGKTTVTLEVSDGMVTNSDEVVIHVVDPFRFFSVETRHPISGQVLKDDRLYEVRKCQADVEFATPPFAPGAVGLDAASLRRDGTTLFSVAKNSGIYGTGYLQRDVVYVFEPYSRETSVAFSWEALGDSPGNIVAIDELRDGTLAFAVDEFRTVFSSGGLIFLTPGNVYRFVDGTVELLLDGHALGLRDIDALAVLDDGSIVLSTATDQTASETYLLQQNAYTVSSEGSFSLYFDGNALALRDLDAFDAQSAEDAAAGLGLPAVFRRRAERSGMNEKQRPVRTTPTFWQPMRTAEGRGPAALQ